VTGTAEPPTRTRRGASAVFAGILLSRISGVVRLSLLRSQLGLTVAGDAFAAAMRIPNLLQNLLGEGVLSASFIPVYSRMLADDDEDAGKVAGTVASLLIAVTGVCVAVAVIFAEPLTKVLAYGFPDQTFDLTVQLVRIVVVGTGLLVLSAWCLGVLNSHRRFFLPYVAPVLWNAAQIIVLVFVGLRSWSAEDTAEAVAWAVVVGSAAQLLVQIPSVLAVQPQLRRGLRRLWAPRHQQVHSVVTRFGPALLGRGAIQLSAYIDQLLASFLAIGAVSALVTAQVLYLLPISLFAMSVAAAELPEMSREPLHLRGLAVRLADSIERVWFYIGVVTITFLFAGDLVVGLLFERGSFGPDATLLVALVLGAYTLGMVPAAASRLLQNVLFSQGDVATAARLATVRVAVAAVLGAVLMLQFEQIFVYDGHLSGWTGSAFPAIEPLPAAARGDESLPLRAGTVGLALGAAVGAWVEFVLLRSRVSFMLGRRRVAAGRIAPLLTAASAGTATIALTRLLTRGWPLTARALVVVTAASVVYLLVAVARHVAPARELLDIVLRTGRGQERDGSGVG
jgi:putative peptidoglycan lipid II flippase